MDFLRRLAPRPEGDTTRAVAVLPSRFASGTPLRATVGQARPPQRSDNDELSLSLDATSASAATHILAARRHVVTGVHDPNSGEARPTSPEPQGPATAFAAAHSPQGIAAPLVQPGVALPLSRAILAQRTLRSRDDSQEVHVTIGRIDVVANTAPAPAARRSPTPRQATVTLADYLRGGNEGRR
jgi:hypothetical protein